jgi:hypothetical protein
MLPDWHDEKAQIAAVGEALLDLSYAAGSIRSVPATGPADIAAIKELNKRRDQKREAVLAKYELAEWPFMPSRKEILKALGLPETASDEEMRKAIADLPPDPDSSTWEELESERVSMAKNGNYNPLLNLLRSPIARATLKESTWHLIADVGIGKHKRPKRRPKLTDAQRFNRNRGHRAAYLVPVIMRMLRAWYPDQKESAIKERAITIAAAITSVQESTLINHLRRPKHDPHRLSDQKLR